MIQQQVCCDNGKEKLPCHKLGEIWDNHGREQGEDNEKRDSPGNTRRIDMDGCNELVS